MNAPTLLLRSYRAVSSCSQSQLATSSKASAARCAARSAAWPRPTPRRPFSSGTRFRASKQPADNPEFVSIIDGPAQMVRVGGQRKFGPMLILLALMPITAFALGTWQVQRLGWKTDLLAKLEDRLLRDPLPLPPNIDPAAVADFDYRRVYAVGRFRHDQEMLIGPRMRDGQDGYMVVTPLERSNGTTILVNRGWISKKHRSQRSRPQSLPTGDVKVEGLLRQPWKKNMFTPENRPEKGEFYFPDVAQMAELTGSQPVWVESTLEPDFMRMMHYETHGIPYGRPAEVNIRNNHAHYILTWYGLSAATAVMLFLVMKKPASPMARRMRATK